MDPKYAIFIVLGSLLTMAIFSSITNYVSAASECFGRGLDTYFCIATEKHANGEGYTILLECSYHKGTCEKVEKVVTPPGVEQLIENTVNDLAPTNPNDSKDLGGMKTDKGITKSPIE
jgi:hypothetical protein